MTHDEMIAVIQAHKEGKKIEHQYHDGHIIQHGWRYVEHPCWDFANAEYRIKHEPEPPILRGIYIGEDIDNPNSFHTTGCYFNGHFPLTSPKWKSDMGYTYRIRGKILAEFDPISHELISVKVVK